MPTYRKTISVDAGIVMIGDPCYSWPSDASSRRELGDGDWSAFCQTLQGPDGDTDICKGVEPFGEGLGTVISSGYGDGVYELIIETEDHGDWGERVSRIVLDFDILNN